MIDGYIEKMMIEKEGEREIKNKKKEKSEIKDKL